MALKVGFSAWQNIWMALGIKDPRAVNVINIFILCLRIQQIHHHLVYRSTLRPESLRVHEVSPRDGKKKFFPSFAGNCFAYIPARSWKAKDEKTSASWHINVSVHLNMTSSTRDVWECLQSARLSPVALECCKKSVRFKSPPGSDKKISFSDAFLAYLIPVGTVEAGSTSA